MIRVDCRFGMLAGTDHLIPQWVRADRSWINEVFAGASGDKIQVMASQVVELSDPRIGSGPYVPLQLHWALAALTMNPPSGSTPTPVPNIAVLFADTYGFPKWQDLFGLMFDPGPQPGLGDPMVGRAAPEFENVPREGCVVFLDAIRRQRPAPEDFEWETAFTTIHELGHVFNLWHIERTPNFMASTARLPHLPREPQRGMHWHFDARHSFFMANAVDFALSPGGAPFGTRGDGFPMGNAGHKAWYPTRLAQDIHLELEISDEEFFAFEPVELDLCVSSRSGGTYEVRSLFDPGYDCFDVWVEEPDGERRRYRSMYQYCGNEAKVRLPFTRDISLLLESGRRFFRKPGRHRLWVSLQVSATRFIKSLPVTCRILDPYEDQHEFQKLWRIMGSHHASSLLFHKYAPPTSKTLPTLRKWVTSNPKEPRTAAVASTLGSILSTYHAQIADKRTATRYRDQAFCLLETALRRNLTGRRRAAKTTSLLEKLSTR